MLSSFLFLVGFTFASPARALSAVTALFTPITTERGWVFGFFWKKPGEGYAAYLPRSQISFSNNTNKYTDELVDLVNQSLAASEKEKETIWLWNDNTV
jgi:hypothetical protein